MILALLMLAVLAVAAFPVAALYIETVNTNRLYIATESGYRELSAKAFERNENRKVRFRA
jgi:hypothetical protein